MGAWLLLVALGAVPQADLDAALAAAQDLERQRAYDAARRQLDELLPLVPEAPGGELRLRRCNLFWLEGALEAAIACYAQAEASLKNLPELRASALYRQATLRLAAGEREAALALCRAVVGKAPSTASAARALELWRGLVRLEAGWAGEVALLLDVAREAGGAELGTSAAIEAGRLLVEHEAFAEALRVLDPVVAPSRPSAWGDDALIWTARALVGLDRFSDAERVYVALLERRESSWFVGSYDSLFFDDAHYELAQARAKRGDVRGALAAVKELEDEAPQSRLLDDARFLAARLLLKQGDTKPLQRFLEAHPDSFHRPEAQRLLEQR